MEKISPEAYQEALKMLGLNKSQADATLIKAEADKAAELKKAEDDKLAADAKKAKEDELKATLEKAELLKAELGIAEPTLEIKPATTTTTESTGAITIQAAPAAALNKAEIVDEASAKVIGFMEAKFEALGTLILSKDEQIAELKKGLETANEFNTILGRKVGIIERQPMDRKSVSTETVAVERFEKGGDAKKNMTVLSISNLDQRRVLVDTLYDSIEKSENGAPKQDKNNLELMKAVRCIEQLGKIGDTPQFVNSILARLNEKHNIQVVN